MDYQIPENDKYPTVWYIATAAHVVNTWWFNDADNTYKQTLPEISDKKLNEHTFTASQNNLWNELKKCAISEKHKPLELKIQKHDDKAREKLSSGLTASQKTIKNPKLFWAALDLFSEETKSKFGIEDDNFKDFAVIEVTFENEQIAKEVTRDFAGKYGISSGNAINIFNNPLDPEKTKDNKLNFYSLGYPYNAADSLFVKNSWSGTNYKGEALSNDWRGKYHKFEEEKVKGFLSTKHFSGERYLLPWGEKKYSTFGHFYYTEDIKLGKGASGAMGVDENGNILGVRAMEGDYSFYVPLRSEEVILKDIKTPKYDLISGSDNQKSSYKKQVQEYLLKNGKKTWLSSLRGWEKIENQGKNK